MRKIDGQIVLFLIVLLWSNRIIGLNKVPMRNDNTQFRLLFIFRKLPEQLFWRSRFFLKYVKTLVS